MGRKPNQVILQYFSRGSKLDDSSNRYQHTCKACGEHFPKGRIEGLINHLTKKCPSLSFQQKQDIVIHFYDLSESGNHLVKNDKTEKLASISLPFSPTKQNFNSLNILAEASRRVGANDPLKDGVYASFESQNGSHLPLDPSLDIDSFTQTYLNDEDNLTTSGNAVVSAAMPSSFSYLPSEPGITSRGHTQGPELSSIAASANDILHPDIEMSHHTIEDSLIFNEAVSENIAKEQQGGRPNHEPQPEHATSTEKLQDPVGISSGSALRPLAVSKEAHFVSESGTSSKSPKPKVRGKFSPNRRQEVREMRQRGACLRCRMLKKTCSNGSPCQACAAIETPRIWKNPCIRTKLVNEFSLYFTGLGAAMTYHKLSELKQQSVTQEGASSLDIYHVDQSPTGISLKGVQLAETAEALSNDNVSTPEKALSAPCFIAGSDNDDISKKVGLYIRTTQDKLLEQDENPFLTTTIKTAQALARQKSDALLASILWLWTCTLLLVDDCPRWKGIVSSETAAMSDGNQALPLDSLPDEVSPLSNQLINAQLRVGVEMCTKPLAKNILADLERRLLQRQQDRQFDTFLAVILLLNCFERMCWLFREQFAKHPNNWPFPQSAEDFVREGERFADIIELLVDMRSLPPRTIFDPVKNTLVPVDNQDELIRRWFDEISITQEYLQFNKDRPFDDNDFHSMDGRFFARLLQPDSERQPKSDPSTRATNAK